LICGSFFSCPSWFDEIIQSLLRLPIIK
jgi:hypothetical protein